MAWVLLWRVKIAQRQKVINFPKKWKAIKNHWIFNIKFDDHYRSQLFTKEFSQVKEINFDKLFSPVAYYKIAYLFLAIATLEYWNIHSVDIETVYLYKDLNKVV